MTQGVPPAPEPLTLDDEALGLAEERAAAGVREDRDLLALLTEERSLLAVEQPDGLGRAHDPQAVVAMLKVLGGDVAYREMHTALAAA